MNARGCGLRKFSYFSPRTQPLFSRNQTPFFPIIGIFRRTPLPIRISPCPIVDAVFEIRFDASVPPGAVFGMVYGAMNHAFPKAIQLQVPSVPEEMRRLNPALLYLSQFRLESEKLAALIGPNMFAVGMLGEYPGWSSLSAGFNETVNLLKKTGVVKTVHRDPKGTTGKSARHFISSGDGHWPGKTQPTPGLA